MEDFILTLLHYFFDLTPFYRLGQKYKNIFVHLLVQMKTLKSPFEINWPLTKPKLFDPKSAANHNLKFGLLGQNSQYTFSHRDFVVCGLYGEREIMVFELQFRISLHWVSVFRVQGQSWFHHLLSQIASALRTHFLTS